MKAKQGNPYSSIDDKGFHLIKDVSRLGTGKQSKTIEQILNEIPNKSELFQNSKIHSSTPNNLGNRNPKSGIRVSYIYSVIEDLESNEKDVKNIIDYKQKIRMRPKKRAVTKKNAESTKCCSNEQKDKELQQITSDDKKPETKEEEENFWNDEDKLSYIK